jgi:DNA-binding Xre family transcriptional regulator
VIAKISAKYAFQIVRCFGATAFLILFAGAEETMIHSNVKLLMRLRGMKTFELAEKAGIDEFTLKKARKNETIESCRLDSLYRIAVALDVCLDDLFEIIDIGTEFYVPK